MDADPVRVPPDPYHESYLTPRRDDMDSWQDRLERGEADGAWAALERDHGRLVRSVIRRLVDQPDLAEEAFSVVVTALTINDFEKLRKYSRDDPSGASMATWLVVVVRRLVIDWLRREHGRSRDTVPTDLEGRRRAMYVARCLERLTAAETYEVVRSEHETQQTFPIFLRELRALSRTHPCPEARPGRQAPLMPLSEELTVTVVDPAEAVDQSRRLASLLDGEPPDLRLAIQLFVVEDLPANEVARLVDWPNAKAVYNRVGRALARMRDALAKSGIAPDDL